MTEQELTKSSGPRNHEDKIILNQMGRKWLISFFSLLRTVKIHTPDNEIFTAPIKTLHETGQKIFDLDGKADFRVLEDQFFLNNLWVKPALSEREQLYQLANHLKSNDMGGISLRANPSESDWRSFLGAIRKVNAPLKERVAEMNRALAEARIEQIEILRLLVLKDQNEEVLPLPALVFAGVKAYSKCLMVLKEFTLSTPGEEQVGAIRKAQRTICEMVEMAEKTPKLFLLLSLLKNFDSYFFHHGVNVCILSLATGVHMGMKRKELVDLGLAALLHDVGKLLLPEELLNKPEDLSEDEWNRIQHHPIDSAKSFMTLGYINESVAERILVAYQHHWASGSPKSYPQPRRPMNPSLMSSIVAVAVTYDALTTPKNYRDSFAPYQAIRILSSQAKKGFYKNEIIKTFLNLMGPAPCGSWVKLDSGEMGLVAVGGCHAPRTHFPLLFVPKEKGSGDWVNTAENNPKTGQRPRLLYIKENRPHTYGVLGSLFNSGDGQIF